MQREFLKYLYDIKEAINSILEFIGDKRNFIEYSSNKLLQRAVERELEIIGEATNRILKMDNSIKIANTRRIVDLRNWIIHGYDRVDNVIIWGIISKDIPELKEQIDNLLNE